MTEILDHKVSFPEGFYDFKVYPERVPIGAHRHVSKQTYILMKGSDPSVELLEVKPPDDILKRIMDSARAEKKAEQVADPEVWKPVGWYKAQLCKDPEVKEYLDEAA